MTNAAPNLTLHVPFEDDHCRIAKVRMPKAEKRPKSGGDRTVLEPNMTLHFMPALWLDDGGLELSESILITANGVECLCKTPRKLVIKN